MVGIYLSDGTLSVERSMEKWCLFVGCGLEVYKRPYDTENFSENSACRKFLAQVGLPFFRLLRYSSDICLPGA